MTSTKRYLKWLIWLCLLVQTFAIPGLFLASSPYLFAYFCLWVLSFSVVTVLSLTVFRS